MAATQKQPFTHDPSDTAAFAMLKDIDFRPQGTRSRAVVIGGGTGAPVSIRTLLSMGIATDAVVAMADDGGSTGILRECAHATAPGDIRKCLTAMAADPNDVLTRAFKMRFTFAENHTMGNLFLAALEASSGSFPEAIRVCEELLHARGHVYPSTLNRVNLRARTKEGLEMMGQATSSHSRTALEYVELVSDQHISAFEPAVKAILSADLIVLGPGSLFTSIIPNLLVPGIVEAIESSRAQVVFVCSLADVQGETRGMGALQHVKKLMGYGLKRSLDAVIVHMPSNASQQSAARSVYDSQNEVSDDGSPSIRIVSCSARDVREMESWGVRVFARDLVDEHYPTWHDPQKLRDVFKEVLEPCPSRRM